MNTTIIRRQEVEARVGYGRSAIYEQMASGVFPKPVKLGPRAVGWPADEVEKINRAKIAGKSEAEIRNLVSQMMAARGCVATA